MLGTLKETFFSLSSKIYGREIIKKTVRQSIWYWSKYVIAVGVLFFVILLGLVFYYTPQAARLLDENLPNLDLTVKDGKAFSSVNQPYLMGDSKFMFILDTKGDPKQLDAYDSGLIILEDKVIAKSKANETQEYKLQDFGDFSFDKQTVVSQVAKNKINLAVTLIITAVALLILGGLAYWIFNLISFLVSSLIIFVFASVVHKKITYTNSFKIAVHAATITFLLSALSLFSSGLFSSIINISLFFIYSFVWVYNIPLLSKQNK